jgi:tetratricopeptide (TPR) repeat protein
MTLTEAEATRHNQLYEEALGLVEREILVDGRSQSTLPGFFAGRRLRKGLRLLDEVLRLNPDNGAAAFLVGKVHQRLGEFAAALPMLLKAHRTDPSFSAYAREAGIVASELGQYPLAIALTEAALRLRPDDGSLHVNLGLMYLLSGAAPEAARSFERAIALEPEHARTPRLLAVARAVQAGSIPCPTTEAELQRAVRRSGH